MSEIEDLLTKIEARAGTRRTNLQDRQGLDELALEAEQRPEPILDPVKEVRRERDERPRARAAPESRRRVDVEQAGTADVAILAALQSPEHEQALAAFSSEWKKEGRDGVVYDVATVEVDGSSAQFVAAVQNDMGMVPAAILATKTIRSWRPRILAMVGICAGVRGKVNLGDIVVARQVFDYGSGKLEGERLVPDYQPVSIDETIAAYIGAVASDKPALAKIRNAWPTASGKPDTELKAHVGAMASGAAVVADEALVTGIKQNKRSLLAIDMEAYGVMRAGASASAPPTLVIKGVQDFADATKDDSCREYAAFVSARFLSTFLHSAWTEIWRERR